MTLTSGSFLLSTSHLMSGVNSRIFSQAIVVSVDSGTTQTSQRQIRLSHCLVHSCVNAIDGETFVTGLETGHISAPASLSFLKIALPFHGLLHFRMNFRIGLPFFTKKSYEGCEWDCIKSKMNLRTSDIFTELNHPICEHGICPAFI